MKAIGGGIGGLILLIIVMLLGGDPGRIMPGNTNTASYQGPPLSPEEEQQLADFVSVVLADTEDTWNKVFAEEGQDYREPTLVLFSGAVESECGFAQSAMGPF